MTKDICEEAQEFMEGTLRLEIPDITRIIRTLLERVKELELTIDAGNAAIEVGRGEIYRLQQKLPALKRLQETAERFIKYGSSNFDAQINCKNWEELKTALAEYEGENK